jgi:5'-3' exonuclease
VGSLTTTLLVDSDIVAYKFASSNQENFKWPNGQASKHLEDFSEVTQQCDVWLSELQDKLNADEMIICLSCPSAEGFRVKVLPTYKGNRVGVEKPAYLQALKDHMKTNYKFYERPTLEADDVMGILSTHPTLIPGKKIIVSEDKDMKTIPGWLFNPRKDKKPKQISESEASYWHFYQTLVGDATDNYKGCPGIGDKKANYWLNTPEVGCSWAGVVAAFESKGLTEEDALVQARVARICRASDYDFRRKEVRLWNPPTLR